jgi:Tfp pilus assembly protein PilX
MIRILIWALVVLIVLALLALVGWFVFTSSGAVIV